MPSHPTIAFGTLGCRTNQAEAAEMLTQLSEACAVVPFGDGADVYVINTCTVTHEADRQSRQLIRRAHRANPAARIVVTGCAVDYRPEDFEGMAGVEFAAPNAQKDRIAEAIARWHDLVLEDSPLPPGRSGRTRAWLKVSEGCNNRCGFCIVPTVRGPERSEDPAVLVDKARDLVAAGYQELVLTGTNIGSYGRDRGDTHLADLIGRILDGVPTLDRLRISSIEPIDFPATLIEAIAHPRVCPHLHLCLQSGSSKVLARMRRRYNADQYRRLVARLRAARPELTLTTDVIVGYPGETDEDFLQTCEMVREIGFAGVHLFPFSVRQGTFAETLSDRVEPAVIAERMTRLQTVAQEAQEQWHRSFLGRDLEVLTEAGSVGTSPHGLKVRLSGEVPRNERWLVRIDSVAEGPLGTLIERR